MLSGGKPGNRDGFIGEQRTLRAPVAEGMAKPGDIVPGGEVSSIMGSATFFAAECAHSDGLRDLQQALNLKGLYQIGVEDPALVLNAHPLRSDFQRFQNSHGFAHGLLSAKNTEIEAHGLAEVIADLPGLFRSRIGQEGLQSLFLVAQDRLRDGLVVTMPDGFSGSRAGPASEHDGFEE